MTDASLKFKESRRKNGMRFLQDGPLQHGHCAVVCSDMEHKHFSMKHLNEKFIEHECGISNLERCKVWTNAEFGPSPAWNHHFQRSRPAHGLHGVKVEG